MSYERRITVAEGKYTFFIPEGDWRIHALRYGEPWVIIENASNAIWALIAELIDAREVIVAIEAWRTDQSHTANLSLIDSHDKFRRERGQEPFKH